jgi:hypothetical protein
LLVAASIAFSFTFACAVPFAAFAAASACTLPRRDAYSLVSAVWLANQTVGFMFLHYPWTVSCVTWRAALGITSLLSTLAARLIVRRLVDVPAIVQTPLIFLAAFAAYAIALIIFSLLLGGIENYSLATQGRILAVNAAALVGLLALDRVGVAVGLAPAAGSPSPVTVLHT